MKRSQPWYADAKAQIERADGYFNALDQISAMIPDQNFNAEIHNYDWFTVYRMIFESNRIEKAGLSEGETKKLIAEVALRENVSVMALMHRTSDQVEVRVKFGRYSRKKQEVRQHLEALGKATQLAYELKINLLDERESSIRKILSMIRGERLEKESFVKAPMFSQASIKELHRIMAAGLIPKVWNGLEAGQYRNDACHTDGEMLYVAHQNLPAAMEKWVDDSNALMDSDDSPVMKAARISYDFNAIHPFPDFNGRLSRIILNMVLRAEGISFWVVLRGGAKDKHKYLTALKHANHGNLERYACLIARAVNEGFEQLNERLKLAGLEPIDPSASAEPPPSG